MEDVLRGSTMERFVNVTAPPTGERYPCPCCRCRTLQERGAEEICPVCYWQDDGMGKTTMTPTLCEEARTEAYPCQRHG